MEAETGRYVSTVSQWRFGSAAQHVKRLMQNGALGHMLLGHCQTLWFREMPYYQVPGRGKRGAHLGGVTTTLGIHLMDLFLWLMMEEWEEISALTATLDREIETENVSLALVRFGSGALASISNSAVSPRQETHLRLDFQRATVEVNALYRYSNANWRFTLPESHADEGELARLQAIESDLMGTHGVQLLALLDSMERAERPLVSGDEARRILEFCSSLFKSARTGEPVRRGSITPDDPFYHAMTGIPQEQIG